MPRPPRTPDAVRHLMQLAFEASPDGMLIHEGGKVVAANETACKMLGRSQSDTVGQAVLGLVTPDGRREVAARIKERKMGSYDAQLLHPDGSTVSAQVSVLHHRLDDGHVRIVYLREIATDEEDARRAENWDRDAEVKRLEQMNSFKTQLLNTAAHELNTPLTPLRLQVHLLASESLGSLSDRQGKAVRVLERNVERLALLVSDILDVARLESGHLRVEKQETDLVELAEEALTSYEETARGVGVSLTVEGPETMPVAADPRRILQVLYNLVSNGIKFTPQGGSVIIRILRDGPYAAIDVIDTGLGMTKAQMGDLFQPFSRVHDTETTAIPGTGLGLYISRGIAQQHGGDLTVSSLGPGRGASFRMAVPLEHTEVVEAPVPAPSAIVQGPLAQRLRELI